jgi:multiple sugar transport system permease protein
VFAAAMDPLLLRHQWRPGAREPCFSVELQVNWLTNPKTAIWTLITLAAWQFGSPMLIFLAGLKQIPAELYESASIDGAGAWDKFTKITFPMLTPVILFNW